jgi:carboxymethylenebutenolidase
MEPNLERKKASDYPQELLNLFDKYVHGDIDRRAFLDGAQKFAVGGLTATMIWESLRPNYAWAQQVPKDDKRIKAEYLTVPSPQGKRQYQGILCSSRQRDRKLPGVLVVHENRGLNPYIEDVARVLGAANFMASARTPSPAWAAILAMKEKGAANFRTVTARRWARISMPPAAGSSARGLHRARLAPSASASAGSSILSR